VIFNRKNLPFKNQRAGFAHSFKQADAHFKETRDAAESLIP
jgi:hypothetical protein